MINEGLDVRRSAHIPYPAGSRTSSPTRACPNADPGGGVYCNMGPGDPLNRLGIYRASRCEDGNPPGEKMRFSGIYSPERSARHSAVVYGRTVTSSIVFDVFFPTTFTE